MAINLPIVSKFDNKGIKDAESALGGMKPTLKTIAGLLAAAFSVKAITNFTKESIKAAEQISTSGARIDQIASSMGIFGDDVDAVTERLKAYADQNEQLFAVDENVIMQTQAKLLTFKELAGSADEAGGAFDRATQAAIDLAAAGFGQAETNAVQLGKALEDPKKGISALTRVGVTFTDAEKEKIAALQESGDMLGAQEIILAALETQVGGTAEATANASDRMSLAFGEIQEAAGAALMPAFAALAEAMIPIAEEVAPLLADAISEIVPTLVDLAGMLPILIEAFLPLLPVIVDIIGLFAELAKEFMPLVIDVIGLLIGVVADIIPLFIEFFTDALMPLIPVVVDIVKKFIPLIEDTLPILIRLVETVLPLILTLLEDLFMPLIPIVFELIEAFLPLLEAVLPVLIDLLDMFVIPTLQLLAEILKVTLVAAIGFFTGALEDIGPVTEGAAKLFEDVWNGVTKFFTGFVNGLIGLFEGFVNGAIDGINNLIRAMNKIKLDIPATPFTSAFSIGVNLPTIAKVRIPRLAEGGVVMPRPGGVFANIAEAGRPEAVIPLDRFDSLGGQRVVNYNITVNAGMGSDGNRIGEQIVNEILRFERSSGRVFARA